MKSPPAIAALRSAKNARPDDYRTDVAALLERLEKCSFPATKATAESLGAATLHEEDGVITPAAARELDAMAVAVRLALEHEAAAQQVIVLDVAGVSSKLRGLLSVLTLSDTQMHLLDETVRCLECAAYRGAAVMGWNLAYDYIRRWMWDDTGRRSAFNVKLMALTSRGAPVYAGPFTAYEDFYSVRPILGERELLDLMKDAGQLTGVYEKLISLLKDRNSFAHANNLKPGMYQTNYYIEQLVDIITSAPFV